MTMDIAQQIRELAPTVDDGSWPDVLGRARQRRAHRRPVAALALLAAVVAIAAALVPGWLAGDPRIGVLDRALAAVSGGPVLHVVLEVDTADMWAGPEGTKRTFSVVDLSSGAERTIQSALELWYDPDADRTREVVSVDGLAGIDSLAPPPGAAPGERSGMDPALAAFFTGYRQALERGEARAAGTEVVNGRRVEWLFFPSANDPGNGSEVGLETGSDRAVFLRYVCATCDASYRPRLYRIRTLEGVERDPSDFTPTLQKAPRMPYGDGGGHRINLSEAEGLLGRPVLWLGRTIEGLPFSLAEYRWASGNTGLPPTRANEVGRGKGLHILYGVDVGPTGRRYAIAPGQPYVGISETEDYRFVGNFRGYGLAVPQTITGGPVPEFDEVALMGEEGGESPHWVAQFRKDGLYVEISAPTRELVLAAARALQPVP